jgi:endonuclease/exonuclease/phosphatase family metal-dependent hydrolase
VRRVAALGAVLALLVSAAPAAAEPLTVMTFNVWYGGGQVEFDRIGDAIEAAGADVVGVQEPEGQLRRIAEAAGMSYVDDSLHLISRYPIHPAQRDGIRFGYVAPSPRRVVAIANVHLPWGPYGPVLVRDGRTPAQVLRNERATRLGEIRPYLRPLARLGARGVPTFLVGDFNSPSHLDWTPAAAAAQAVRYPLRWPVSAALERAGFRDSYREAHPDPVARPGLTWTPGTPPPRIRPRETLDRIDWITATGPATTVASRLVGEPGGPDVDVGVPWGSDHRAVASTFEVTPAEAPPLATAEPRVVRRGTPVTVRYTDAARAPGRRVAVLPARGGRPIMTLPIYGATDHMAAFFGTGGLRPGAYRAGLVSGRGDVVAASRFWVLASDARPRIRTSRRVYAPGQPIRLRWSGMPGNRLDWIGIYRARPTLDVYGYLGFSYLDALPMGRLTMTTADLGRLPPGRYVAGLFMDDGYAVLARTRFMVARSE